MFDVKSTYDTTVSGKVSKHSSIFFTKKDIYRLNLVVTLLQVFPKLFPFVYFIRRPVKTHTDPEWSSLFHYLVCGSS